MKRSLWLFHPISIFIFSVVALGASLFLYIYLYVEVSTGLQSVIEKTNLDVEQFVTWQTWVVILVLSILVGIILAGIFIIFAYQRKTLALYRSQHKFINSFTHELKTPTTSLNLYLETFIKHDLPRDMQLKYLNYMMADVERLTDNINNILNLARVEAKIYGEKFVTIDVVEEVEKFCKANAQLFRGSNIVIKREREDIPFFCSINTSLFHMILMNLLSNATKHNRNEVPEITISFSLTDKQVRISLLDNGIGFEKSQARKIFKKFFQVERSDWSYPGGTGLGLYMVAQAVKFHKGRIFAKSDGIGKGAQFTMVLPREAAPSA